MPRVQDIVYDRPFAYVAEHETVAAVARRMADLHCGAILVLDRGKLRGVFSERDIMHRVVLERRDAPSRNPLPSKTPWRRCRPTVAGTCR